MVILDVKFNVVDRVFIAIFFHKIVNVTKPKGLFFFSSMSGGIFWCGKKFFGSNHFITPKVIVFI